MTPARFRWGLLFILAGTLLLLAQADVLNLNFLFEFVYFLPFLLIAIGIEKIFAKTRLKAISYLTSILLVGGALYVAFEGSRFTESSSFFESSSYRFEADDDPVDIISAELMLTDASLSIDKPTDELVTARFGEWTHKPRIRTSVIDGKADISMTARSGSRRFWGGAVEVDVDEKDDWRVSFSRDIPLILKCDGRESDISLRLADTPLRELRLDLDDADIYVRLGMLEPMVLVTVGGDDSKLRLRVPQDAGLMVAGTDDIEYLREIGLTEKEGAFVSESYDESEVRIQVDLDGRFRSLSIDSY